MADVDVVVRAQQALDDLRAGRSADAVTVIEMLVAEVERLREEAARKPKTETVTETIRVRLR